MTDEIDLRKVESRQEYCKGEWVLDPIDERAHIIAGNTVRHIPNVLVTMGRPVDMGDGKYITVTEYLLDPSGGYPKCLRRIAVFEDDPDYDYLLRKYLEACNLQ